MKFKTFPSQAFILGIISSLLFILAFFFINKHNLHWDERFILDPILGKKEFIYYPDFPYDFYSIGIKFLGFFLPIDDPSQIARNLNCLLYGVNSILFYQFLKNYFSKWWSIVGVLFFSLTPGVFLAAIEIKTESLLLLELLLLMIGLEKLVKVPWKEKLLYGGFCGFICALGFTTKYFILFPILFLSTIFYYNKGSKNSLFSRINFGVLGVFSFFFVLGIFVTFPNVIENIIEVINGRFSNKSSYFTSGPNPFMAVDEWFSFPFGRFSYALLSTIPINLGFFNFLTALFSLVMRKVPVKAMIIYFPFLISLFFYLCFLSLFRIHFMFTLLSPIIILFSLFFWRDFLNHWNVGGKKYFSKIILISALIYSFLDSSRVSEFMIAYFRITQEEIPSFIYNKYAQEEQTIQNIGFALLNDGDCPTPCLRKRILQERPKVIVIHSALIDNFCKYRSNQEFRDICKYFRNLISENLQYRLIWKRSFEMSKRPWNFDPELKSNIYIFEKRPTFQD